MNYLSLVKCNLEVRKKLIISLIINSDIPIVLPLFFVHIRFNLNVV